MAEGGKTERHEDRCFRAFMEVFFESCLRGPRFVNFPLPLNLPSKAEVDQAARYITKSFERLGAAMNENIKRALARGRTQPMKTELEILLEKLKAVEAGMDRRDLRKLLGFKPRKDEEDYEFEPEFELVIRLAVLLAGLAQLREQKMERLEARAMSLEGRLASLEKDHENHEHKVLIPGNILTGNKTATALPVNSLYEPPF